MIPTHRDHGGDKVTTVVELAVRRVLQDPDGYDPSKLFLDLDRAQRAEIVAELPGDPPRDRLSRLRMLGSVGAARFARFVCDLAAAEVSS